MTQPDTLAKLAAPSDFPPRIMALLRTVADRKPGNGQGPWEDEQGEPMQDDADAAIAWIYAQALPAAPEPWDAQPFTAPVYPPDGTKSPFTVINLGLGKVQMGDSIHDQRLPALWFGTNGQGMGHEEIMNREARPGETLAVVTFSNVEGLDVLLEAIQRIRRQSFPEAPAAQQAAQATAGWQTIETAPKDGRAILVSDGRFVFCVEWNEEFDWWGVDDNKLGPFRLRGASPTHWQPLPAPPAALPQPQPQSAQTQEGK